MDAKITIFEQRSSQFLPEADDSITLRESSPILLDDSKKENT